MWLLLVLFVGDVSFSRIILPEGQYTDGALRENFLPDFITRQGVLEGPLPLRSLHQWKCATLSL